MDRDLRDFFNSLEMDSGVNLADRYHRDVYHLLFHAKTQLRRDDRVLELGTGPGRWIQLFPGGIGLDIAIRHLRRAREKGVLAVGGDCRALPFPSDRFGLVFSLGVIEHFDDSEQAIAEHVRVCRPGGFVIVGVINRRSPMAFSRWVERRARGMTAREAMIRWGKRYTRREFMDMMDRPELRGRRMLVTGNIISGFVLGRYCAWLNRLTEPVLRRWIGNELIVVARKRSPDRLAEARSRYLAAAARYAERYTGTMGRYFRRLEEDPVARLLDPADGDVLDLGTGTGRIARRLAPRARWTVGVDVSPEMLAAARDGAGPGIALAVMDGERTAFRDGSFDAVVAVGALEATHDLGPAFAEAARLLRPGGRFVFTSFNRRRLTPLGAYALGDDTRAHPLEAIRERLAAHGLALARWEGTFFVSPRFVWKWHGHLRFRPLRRIFVEAVIALNRVLNLSRLTRRRCGQFVVLAEKR